MNRIETALPLSRFFLLKARTKVHFIWDKNYILHIYIYIYIYIYICYNFTPNIFIFIKLHGKILNYIKWNFELQAIQTGISLW